MVSNTKTMRIACAVMPDGQVSFVPEDPASINTTMKKWRESIGEERLAEHQNANTLGGVVVVTMLADDYFRMRRKELRNANTETP